MHGAIELIGMAFLGKQFHAKEEKHSAVPLRSGTRTPKAQGAVLEVPVSVSKAGAKRMVPDSSWWCSVTG